jgi:hypothetical protein
MYFLLNLAFELVAVHEESLITGFYYEIMHSVREKTIVSQDINLQLPLIKLETISNYNRD